MAVFQGTSSVTNGSATVVFTGPTLSPLAVFPGAQVSLGGYFAVIASITNTTTFVLTTPFTGTTNASVPTTINTISENESDIVTLNTRTADLIEDLLSWDAYGNLASISDLQGNGVILQSATGAHVLVPKSELTAGVNTDGKAQTIAQRNSLYGSQPAGFSVFVNDVGDGRSAVYYKLSNTVNDWSTAGYVTGPVGPTSTVPGIIWRGTYAAGTLYAINDGVTLNGSSFRKLTTAAAGTSPSTAIPPVNTAAWEVLAARGVNGTGTGDVVGPTISVNNGLVVFSGTTGKLIAAAPNSVVTNALLANMATATIKGRVAAGTGDAQDLTVAQVLTLLNAYAKSNIVGTVSQSAGVPTGGIIERGSNANGSYIKFADGTLICWAQNAGTVGAPSALDAGIYYGSVFWTFPAVFIAAPAVNSVSTNAARWGGSTPSINTTSAQLTHFQPTTAPSTVLTALSGIAIGRWI